MGPQCEHRPTFIAINIQRLSLQNVFFKFYHVFTFLTSLTFFHFNVFYRLHLGPMTVNL